MISSERGMMGKKLDINASLTVVMPVYNEINTIQQIINRVLAEPIVGQLIVVNDCSTDGTQEFLKVLKGDNRILILNHEKNQGKGASISSAKKYVDCPYVIIQDADLEYDPSQYSKMVLPLISNIADVVYGSRFQTSEIRRVLLFWHYVGNRFLTLLSNALTNLNLSDMETCFKAMRSEIFRNIDIKEKRFGVEPEITAKLATNKLRFYEVSISYYGRTYDDGKKIGVKDGFRAIYCIIKYNLFWSRKRTRELFNSRTQIY